MYNSEQELILLKNRKSAVISGLIAGLLIIACIIPAAHAFTDDDPLITLSYLEDVVIPALKEELLDFIGENKAQEAEEEKQEEVVEKQEEVPEEESEPQISSEAIGTYKLLELSKGEYIMAESICEFIVRPGSKVVAVSPFEGQGIADITNGIEVLADEQISINAYCLIPRGGDGRGMKVVSDKAYIMIRGEYTIV